ncbi:MAG: DEAD/DEAH box helicase [Leptospirales bacterium]|nr:DEAD/DEAH box helicase [Leptospirales bacterium]
MDKALIPFSPLVRQWFEARFGGPTEAQRLAWPAIASGEHVLLSAPTGSGKTLSAFLWALDSLFSGRWGGGELRVLYLSPLRALGADIERNLTEPLRELYAMQQAELSSAVPVRVAVRNGDTPAAERQRQLRKPPEILITTPESLFIMLTARRSRNLFGGLCCVIIDEIHALIGDRRGSLVSVCQERLFDLAGDFQRIALSATTRPLESAARFAGGYVESAGKFTPRPVTILQAAGQRPLELRVHAAPEAQDPEADTAPEAVWDRLAPEFVARIRKNRSTLIFVNSRRLAERITRSINEVAGENLALCHHGSLSRELRHAAEERLKSGQLPAIVATSSLELGIDIGAVDEVLLLQCPPTIASLLQRVGRSGRSMEQTSRGLIFPAHDLDYLDAAVAVRAALQGEIEPIGVMQSPLDALAQILVSFACSGEQPMEETYRTLRRSDAYHSLNLRQFELCLEMLAGRYESTRIRELRPRIANDQERRVFMAREGAERVLYMAGGMIPDRGYFALRTSEGQKLGDLDEEFVWERSIGEVIAFGRRNWRIEAITHNDVMVSESAARSNIIPFWKAEDQDRSFATAEHSLRFLSRAAAEIDSPDFCQSLEQEYAMAPEAASRLCALLLQQRLASGGAIPHRHCVLFESVQSGGEGEARQVFVHTFWGGKVNRPFALLLRAAWRERFGHTIQTMHDDRAVTLILPLEISAAQFLDLVQPQRSLELLQMALENSSLFGARFREAAGRSLLLPPRGFGQRSPLWFTRMRASRLQNAVRASGDFPAMIEAWRSSLQDDFDLPSLERLLGELKTGAIAVHAFHSGAPSPFARNLAWRETNYFMYQDDRPERDQSASLQRAWIDQVAGGAPPVSEQLVTELEERLMRLRVGDAPQPGLELFEFIRDLVAVSAVEWRKLAAAIERDHGTEELLAIDDQGSPVARVDDLLVHQQCYARLQSLIGDSSATQQAGGEASGEFVAWLEEWMRHRGPRSVARLARELHLDTGALRRALLKLQQRGLVLRFSAALEGQDSAEFFCDRQNFERLLYLGRRQARARIPHLKSAEWSYFVLDLQRGADLRQILERLFGYPADAALWEDWIFPTRLEHYDAPELDALLANGDPHWFGVAQRRLAFSFAADRELFDTAQGRDSAEGAEATPSADGVEQALLLALGEEGARFDLKSIALRSSLSMATVEQALWRLCWEGQVVVEGFHAVRRAISRKFKFSSERRDASIEGGASVRSSAPLRFASRWSASQSLAQTWRRLPRIVEESDPWRAEEIAEARARQLLLRYGIVFRELCERETAAVQWRHISRSLRRLELAGEVVAGDFIRGPTGMQFASHEALRLLESQSYRQPASFLLHVADPASPLRLLDDEFRDQAAAIRGDAWRFFCRGRCCALLVGGGRRLWLSTDCDPADVAELASALHRMLKRRARSPGRLRILEINGAPALKSKWAEALIAGGFRRDYNALSLHR